jgi:phytoene dehydrogenase-like protein
MARYDVVVIGAGLGGLTAGAILARDGRKVLVIERSNSVGGAASSYKVGDLFVEGSLHETSDPRDPRDPKHELLKRAGVLEAVTWSPSEVFYEVRGGPIASPLALPASFDGARATLIQRFPEARAGLEQIMQEIEQGPPESEQSIALTQKLDSLFGSNEAVKSAIAANLAYYHDDPATLLWTHFAEAQGHYLRNGPCFIKGGSQRLSSAMARAIKAAGSDAVLRRTVINVSPGSDGIHTITHTAKDGGDPQTVEAACVISNAAPETLAALLPDGAAARLRHHYATMTPSISLFALTLGLSRPPREVGFTSYSTQLLPPWMTHFSDYPRGTLLFADEPGDRMPPMAIVDYSAIDSGVPAPPHVLSIFGPDRLTNWDSSDMDRYREKRARWQDAIVRYLDGQYPGLASAVTASSFNTALSTRQYLNAPEGAVYGFAPTVAQADVTRSPCTPVDGLYLSSAYANTGGYTGVIQAGAACADVILRKAS